ncbi:sugar phosphate isomerase/epimerase family protein [Dyadobacter fermentans]|uniref:Xylose isomerase domain protein TIM barrel n=1 Tax=Dyadobacter fermentans (strain ATCC 700827 / DSM 18053 / CIP 107007 / KCTC 52180 / NS114) TaxID=471854 RepID=C6VXI1_DYAFD|nr:xylose isomerase [Dyadobacter fermentans]ACT93324.1 Xylose isomerase domain protein TIM barrel [Dyadobacter fermentans DSM 18053]
MNIQFFAPEWGNTLPFDTFCANVKAAGYDGVEMALPFEAPEKQAILDTLAAHGLQLIGQYWQSLEKDIDEHAANYEKYLRNLIDARPVLINCQTGKDYFDNAQNQRLFALAAALSAESGIPIIHETHRGKSLFAAHVTKHYLQTNPKLRIALDISHWCSVHESLLADLPDEVALAISRTDHIHSRVGHPEGPQVNDPRAPEWADVLDAHLGWWDRVVAAHEQRGTTLTITTEFGPAPYMPSMPYTQMPLVSQWDVNVHMKNLLQQRYRNN